MVCWGAAGGFPVWKAYRRQLVRAHTMCRDRPAGSETTLRVFSGHRQGLRLVLMGGIIWSILRELGLGDANCELLQVLQADMTSEVEWQGHTTAPVPVRWWLRQGCPLSPLLFMVHVEGVTESLEASGTGFSLEHHS